MATDKLHSRAVWAEGCNCLWNQCFFCFLSYSRQSQHSAPAAPACQLFVHNLTLAVSGAIVTHKFLMCLATLPPPSTCVLQLLQLRYSVSSWKYHIIYYQTRKTKRKKKRKKRKNKKKNILVISSVSLRRVFTSCVRCLKVKDCAPLLCVQTERCSWNW